MQANQDDIQWGWLDVKHRTPHADKADRYICEHLTLHVMHAGAHCVRCRKEHSLEHVREAVSQGKTRCECTVCGEPILLF